VPGFQNVLVCELAPGGGTRRQSAQSVSRSEIVLRAAVPWYSSGGRDGLAAQTGLFSKRILAALVTERANADGYVITDHIHSGPGMHARFRLFRCINGSVVGTVPIGAPAIG